MRNTYLNIEPIRRAAGTRWSKGWKMPAGSFMAVFACRLQKIPIFREKPVLLCPLPDLPMEELYPRQARTDIAEVYIRKLGQPGRLFPLGYGPDLLGSLE